MSLIINHSAGPVNGNRPNKRLDIGPKIRNNDNKNYSYLEAMMADGKLRMTEQRQVILEELRKVKTHPTADEVYDMVRRRLPRISMGTVYRNLDLLSESGVIRKLDIGRQRRFDGDTTEHYHVRCAGCGRVADLHAGPIGGLDEFIKNGREFDIIGYRLEFMGICRSCRKTGKNGGKPA